MIARELDVDVDTGALELTDDQLDVIKSIARRCDLEADDVLAWAPRVA